MKYADYDTAIRGGKKQTITVLNNNEEVVKEIVRTICKAGDSALHDVIGQPMVRYNGKVYFLRDSEEHGLAIIESDRSNWKLTEIV